MKGKLLRSLAAALCLACLLLPVRAEEAPEVKLTLLGHSVGISLPANNRLDLAVSASCDGILTIRWPISGSPAFESPVSEGRNDLSVEIWEEGMEAPDGSYVLSVALRDADGTSTDTKKITVTLKNDPADAPPSVWDQEPDAGEDTVQLYVSYLRDKLKWVGSRVTVVCADAGYRLTVSGDDK